jgi:hypothetical protein
VHATHFVKDTSVTGAPVVVDNWTGLTWQGCADGLTGDLCGTGSVATLTFGGALVYCKNLTWGGYDDWRVPNPRELHSIVHGQVNDPAINYAIFKETPAQAFWTNTTYVPILADGWTVDFESGQTLPSTKSTAQAVRCVRGA